MDKTKKVVLSTSKLYTRLDARVLNLAYCVTERELMHVVVAVSTPGFPSCLARVFISFRDFAA